MMAPLKTADIDVFIVLDPKYYTNKGQATLLQTLKTSLRKTYPKTPDIHPDGQAVTIEFSDFKVDVVPCFNRQGGGFLIPNQVTASWIETDPKKHIEIWSAANKWHDGQLIPLIKMLKGWNISRKIFKSFHLEVVALSVLSGVRIDSYHSGLRYVFDKAREKINFKLADPAGYNDDVAAHVSTTEAINRIVAALEVAYITANDAEVLAARGNMKVAFERWSTLLDGYFPSYG